MVKCRDCKHFKTSNEFFVEERFVKKTVYGLLVAPYVEDVCQHEECFHYDVKNDPVDGTVVTRERISGQALLNKNNDCVYFEEKFNLIKYIKNLL